MTFSWSIAEGSDFFKDSVVSNSKNIYVKTRYCKRSKNTHIMTHCLFFSFLSQRLSKQHISNYTILFCTFSFFILQTWCNSINVAKYAYTNYVNKKVFERFFIMLGYSTIVWVVHIEYGKNHQNKSKGIC